jgi:hypothetical protein
MTTGAQHADRDDCQFLEPVKRVRRRAPRMSVERVA